MRSTHPNEISIRFYEGKFRKPKPYFPPDSLFTRLGLILSIYSVQRYFDKYVPARNFLLDLGCGGGWMLLRVKAKNVIGVDLSRASLNSARILYGNCVRADINFLPFRNDAFDVVASSDVLGHIPASFKEGIVFEIRRVLKEGGVTFHLVEVDGQGVLPSWCKKYPELYERYIIDLDGHYGLELPSVASERFTSCEFRNCTAKKIYSGLLWPVTEYAKRFDNEFKNKSLFIKALARASKIIVKNFYVHAMVDCLLGTVSRFWDAVTPFDWADGIYIYACK